MEELSRDDAIGFYRRFYAPNNAVVVIAGDVDPAKARALVEETYGKVPRHNNLPPRIRAQEPPPVVARSLTLADARAEIPTQSVNIPAVLRDDKRESMALEATPHILGSVEQPTLSRSRRR
jgi:zinc protease